MRSNHRADDDDCCGEAARLFTNGITTTPNDQFQEPLQGVMGLTWNSTTEFEVITDTRRRALNPLNLLPIANFHVLLLA